MAKHFGTKYNGTETVLFDEDSNEVETLGAIETIESDEDFAKWAESESLTCRFDDEVYIKFKRDGENFEAMTITDANEYLGEQD